MRQEILIRNLTEKNKHCFNPKAAAELTTVCRAFVAHITTVVVSVTQV